MTNKIMNQRELKFRAWDGDTMHTPSNGDYVALFSGPGQVAWRLYRRDESAICDSQYGGVLMQYTGLKDKNGVEIYESDVIDSGSKRSSDGSSILYKVEWSAEGMGWDLKQLGNYCLTGGIYLEKCSVIGNIYQHPDLLK